MSRLALGLICLGPVAPGRSIRLEDVVVPGLPGTEVPLNVSWVRRSDWMACSPVEVGLLLELQGSGWLYWQVSFFRISAGSLLSAVQFAFLLGVTC